jgi:hypothetical protein
MGVESKFTRLSKEEDRGWSGKTGKRLSRARNLPKLATTTNNKTGSSVKLEAYLKQNFL